MKSSIGGCGVGGEDVSMGPKSNQNISLFILLSENCESFERIHDTGNDHQLRRSYWLLLAARGRISNYSTEYTTSPYNSSVWNFFIIE